MSSARRFFIGVASLLLALGAGTYGAHAAATKPVLLPILVGTWNCTYTGPKGTSTSTITFTAVNDLWVQDTEKDSAYGDRPAHTGFGAVGYDPKKHQYIGWGASTIPGDYGVGVADASPAAMSMTFTGAYPADPTHDKTTYHFSATKMTSVDTFMEKGSSKTGHGSCTKQ